MIETKSSYKEVSLMREIALTAAFIAMVFLSTSLFYIALVSSTGFFNLGEAFVYLAALIGGPIVGALAGGIGAAMADMILGYGAFAPATLTLKGMEGFTVGFLYQSGQKVSQRIRYILLGLISVFLLAFAIFVISPELQEALLNPLLEEDIQGSSTIQGAFVIHIPNFSGTQILEFELPGFFKWDIPIPFEITQEEISFEFLGVIMLVIVLALISIIWFFELKMGEKGQMVLSCLLAGPIIVVGYFLYEIFFLNVPVGGALSEIPFNIAQVVFGILIAVPIISYLKELGIIRSKEESSSVRRQEDKIEKTLE